MKKALAFSLLLFVLFCQFSSAQTSEEMIVEEDSWKWFIMPYLWTSSIDGDVTARGQEASFDMDFSDILDMLNFAFMLRGEACKGNLGFTGDLIYIDIGNDVDMEALVPGVSVESDITMVIVELGISYLLYNVPLGPQKDSKNKGLTFEIMGGGRYAYLDIGLDFSPGPNPRQSDSYVEPFIGGRIMWYATEKLTLGIRGDIGGFNIGSKFTWNVILGLDYQVNNWFSLGIGYRAMSIDFEKGDGDAKMEANTTMQGPGLEATIYF